jgi:PAS domain S-box-containing protein
MTTALIVDDHEQNLYLLQTLLESDGYTVVQARNGSEALELARHNPPNIVISDILMPVMDGFALCREWNKDERLQNIPFVFYTATYTDSKDEDLGLSLGAARFIIKPTEPEAFVVVLQQVLQEHAAGGLVAPRQPVEEETAYYRLYNEALIRKLEGKMLELEQVNRALEQDIAERKRAEEALHVSEERYRSLFENSDDAILLTAPDGRIFAANPAACRIVGRTEAEICQAGRASVVDPTDPRLPIALEERERTGKFRGELTCLRSDGQPFPGEVTSVVFQGENGQPRTSMIIRDITGRKQAEEALRESEDKFKYVFDHSIVGKSITLPSGEISVNKAFCDILGYTQEELQNQRWQDITHPDDVDLTQLAIDPLLFGEQDSARFTKRYTHKSGAVVWADVSTSLRRDKDGKPLYFMTTVSDITERKRAEASLRALSERQEAILSAVPDIIMEVDNNKVYTWVNQAGFEFFGEDVIGQEAAFYFEGEQDTYRAVQPLFNGNENVIYVESWQRRKDGQKRLLAWWCRVLKDDRGNVTGALSSARDITERAQMEVALRDKVSALQALAEIDREVIAATQSQVVLDLVCRRAAELLRVPKSGITLEAPSGDVNMVASYGMLDVARAQEEFTRKWRGGIMRGDRLRERGAFGMDDIAADAPYMPELATREGVRAIAIAPMMADGRTLGALVVLDTAPRVWSADELQLLGLLAGQAALALDKVQLFEAEHAGRQRLETLYRIGQAINSTLDAGAILDRLTDEAMRATHATHGSALIALPDLGHFERRSLRGYSPELAERARAARLPLNHGVNGRAYHSRQVVCVDDVQADPNYFPLVPDTRAELAVPIMRGGQVLGNLDLQSPEIGAFRDVDLGLLQALTDQVAIALENARLFGETRRRLDELAVVSHVALIGAAGRPFDETVARATDSLIELWPDVNVSFLFVDETDQSLRLHPSARGVSPEIIASLRVPLNQGITGWVVRERLPVRVGDVTADPRYVVGVPGAGSEIAAPLVAGERVIGVVNVESPRLNAFSGDDLRLLTTLAGQLATIFEKARLDAALEAERAALEEERALLARRVEERTAELNIANAGLRQAARAKDEFLAGMSHELRTPLTAILGMSEVLQEQFFGPLNEKQVWYVHTIEESGRHLLALINDILDLSKVEAGKVELQISRVVVESVCQASLQFIKEAAHRKQVKVSFSLDNKVSTMQADERRLKQLLVNLLSNAVKFTSEGGDVGLEVLGDAERQMVHFIVWDTGIGITRENIGRLFQPFVQLDSSLSRQYSGTGLGLSLVKRLAELHGGSVSVESKVGKGSRFTVSLPWQEASGGRQEAGGKMQEAPFVLHPASCILLAEDDETNLTTMSDYLSAKGYRVIVARDGHEVIQRAREDRPDVVLMDIQMPGMDGLEAIRHIRAEPDPRVAQVPIIALTAIAMSGDRQRCLDAGANEYLSKPVSLKELVEVIETQLRET